MFDGSNYVCIVGCPRSGTTWLQKQLAAHPCVATGQESQLFNVYIGPILRAWRGTLTQKRAVGLPGYVEEATFFAALQQFVQTMLEPMLGGLERDRIFIDKTPCHVLYIPEILELLPRTRFIHIIRDPRDVVASLLDAARSWSPRWIAAKTVRSAAAMWAERVQRALAESAKLPRWQFHQVRYEDLHAAPAETLRGCSEFLGLAWPDADIRRAVASNTIDVLRGGSGGTPIPLWGEAAKREGSTVSEPAGFFRSGKIGSWKTDLSLAEKAYLWWALRRTMAVVGYRW